MAENDLKQLQKELKFKKFQLNSIYELSSAIHSSFDIDHVIRIFFSSLMAQIFEKKKLEYEMKIARDIQLSLLPQELPQLENYDISVIYESIQEVGGDYYDFLKKKKNIQPLVLADVEGKGLSAALLAASCQAIFHSLNELYLFKPAKFIGKANTLIHEISSGSRFITLFWMLLDDEVPALTYVNAGHNPPYLISGAKVTKLSEGGFLIGFSDSSQYEQKTISLGHGDIVCAFTDGVFEVQNPEGEEFGEQAMVEFIQQNSDLSAAELSNGLYKKIKNFSKNTNFRDDFTILIIKVR